MQLAIVQKINSNSQNILQKRGLIEKRRDEFRRT